MDFDILVIIAATPVLLLLLVDIYWLVTKIIKIAKKSDSKGGSEAEAAPKKFSVLKFLWSKRLLWANMAIPVFAAAILIGAYSPAPRIESSYPEWESTWDTYSKPIELIFNIPVKIDSLNPQLSNTELAGTWKYEPYLGFLPITRVARFYPETTLPPNRRLVVYMTGVRRWGINESHEHPLNLFTHKDPEVFFAAPGNGSVEVPTNTQIKFDLNKPTEGLSDWTFEIEPKIEFEVEALEDQSFILKPKQDLAQSEEYTVSVFRADLTRNILSQEITERDNPDKVHEIVFSTVRAPLVKKFTPSGTGVKIDSPITIEFEIEMNRESVEQMLQLEPVIDYTINWTSNSKLVIEPTAELPKETRYTIKFDKGLKSLNGGMSEIAIEHSFTTIGAVRVSDFSPKRNTVRVARNSNITVVFDQAVNQASAQERFTISPAVAGTFSWQDNTMTFNPNSSLSFNTTYSINVRKGVKTIDGLDSKEDFTNKFTTIPNQTIVAGFGPEDIDLQDSNYSCSVASLKMGLAWKGKNANETDIIYNQIGIYDQPMSGCPTCTWADPNKYFVGFPNGSGTQGNGQTAYGVHWAPVRQVYSNYGVTTELRRNWNTTGLAQTLNAGNPVQIWWWNGVSGAGERTDWRNVENPSQTIESIRGMHSILVVGFNGDPSNPTSFIALDPWWGYQTYSVAKFNVQWPKLQNTGVIIY